MVLLSFGRGGVREEKRFEFRLHVYLYCCIHLCYRFSLFSFLLGEGARCDVGVVHNRFSHLLPRRAARLTFCPYDPRCLTRPKGRNTIGPIQCVFAKNTGESRTLHISIPNPVRVDSESRFELAECACSASDHGEPLGDYSEAEIVVYYLSTVGPSDLVWVGT